MLEEPKPSQHHMASHLDQHLGVSYKKEGKRCGGVGGKEKKDERKKLIDCLHNEASHTQITSVESA